MTGGTFRKPRLAGDKVRNPVQSFPCREDPLRGFNSLLKYAFIAGLTFLVAAEVAYGQSRAPNCGTNDPGIQQRIRNQEQRIDQGVASGRLTPKERQKLHDMQDRTSNHICRYKHDRQKANAR